MIDIVSHINAEWATDTQTKLDFLNYFCLGLNYDSATGETQTQFANRQFIQFAKQWADEGRRKEIINNAVQNLATFSFEGSV